MSRRYIYDERSDDYVCLNDVSSPEQEAYDAAVRRASFARYATDLTAVSLPYPGLPLGYFPQPEARVHDYDLPF